MAQATGIYGGGQASLAMYIHFTLPMSSLMEINFMISPEFGLMLYKDFDDFLENFWKVAFLHLEMFYNGLVPEDYWSVVREARNGVRFLVWARVIPGDSPATEVAFKEVEERDISLHPLEQNHRAG